MVLGTCRDAASPLPTYLTPLGNVTSNPPEILVGAGDIAECDAGSNDEATADLLDGIAGTVFTAGDNAYPNGTLNQFNTCYEPSWGRHKARTRPTPGNHDYDTPGGAGYYAYFGAAAGQAGKGFYSYDLGDWHIVALNNYVPMGSGSEQLNWLVADLAATTKPCILGYYHEPLHSSQTGTGSGGISVGAVRPLVTALYNAGADVIVNGHRHFYERLRPMNPDGQVDLANGVRTFIVGTGGSSMGNPTNVHPLSEFSFGDGTHGVLKLYLYSDSYAWRFVPEAGKTLTDSGSIGCHGVNSGVSPSQSTVTASPTVVPVGGTSTITVTVRNATGQPLPNAIVELSVSPTAGATLTQPAAPTGADGVATGSLRADNAADKFVSATVTLGGQTTPLNQTAQISVSTSSSVVHTLLTAGNNATNMTVYTTASIAPAPNTLITLAVLGRNPNGASPSPAVTGGGMTTWTEVATATFDTRTTPTRRLTIYRAMSASPGSGPLTITFSGAQQGNAQWIVSQWSGVDVSGTNGSGAIQQVGTTNGDAVTGLNVALNAFASANNVAYGGFGVTRNTAVVNPGAGFTEISEQPSGESTPGDLQAEWRVNDNSVDASWGTLILNAAAVALEIKALAGSGGDVVDAAQSSVTVDPATIAAGSGTTTITVTARTAAGNPVSGAVVQLSATGTGNTLSTPAATNGQGVTTATLSSTVAETKVITATANGITLSQQPSVEVTNAAVSPTLSTVTASPTTIAAGGPVSTITVTVKDESGNPISGAAVQLSATGTGNTFSTPAPTNSQGVTTGTLSSTVAETKVITATANGITLSQQPSVEVTNAAVSPTLSTVTASPTTIAAGGPVSTITVTVQDESGNPISGAAVQLSATGTGNTLSTPAPTNSQGVTTGTLSSTVAETKVITVTANGIALSGQPSVQVTSGAVSPAVSTVTASPTSIEPGGQVSTITVVVSDQFGNRISGAAVTLSPSPPAGVTLTQPGTTDAGGTTSGAMSSTVAEPKTITATATVAGVSTVLSQTPTVEVKPQAVGAITHTVLTAANNSANAKAYTTPSITPAPNTLITVAVLARSSSGGSPLPVITGGGMTTWTQVATITFDTRTSPTRRVTIYRAMSAAPGSGPLRIAFSKSQRNAQWIVTQWSGVDLSGTNGSGAIRQVGSTNGDAMTGLSVLLNAFADPNSLAYGVFGAGQNAGVITPGAGFTQISEQFSSETGGGDLQAEWGANQSINAIWSPSLNAGAIGLEIKAGTLGAGAFLPSSPAASLARRTSP